MKNLHNNKSAANISTIDLTEREKQILLLIILELSTREIAEELFLSAETIKTHRHKIMKKLNVKNVAGVVRETIVNNLIPNRMCFAQVA